MLYKVVKCFDGLEVGTVIELNDRRANTELPRGCIELYKEEKRTIINYNVGTKEVKLKIKTKQEKLKRKTK